MLTGVSRVNMAAAQLGVFRDVVTGSILCHHLSIFLHEDDIEWQCEFEKEANWDFCF